VTDVVLVVLRRPETAETLLDAAEHMGTLMGGACLNVLAVREPSPASPLAAAALIAEADVGFRGREQEQQRVAELHDIFSRWVRQATIDARWIEAEGRSATIVAERGSRADLIVGAQPPENDRSARQGFSAALLATNRPVLVVPPGTAAVFGRRVAIAWREDRRAVTAVIPALRYLGAAERVDVLVGVRGGEPHPVMPSVFREHGILAEVHVLAIDSEPFGRTLLDVAHRLRTDLLVMGAYAHSPLRQLILGGVTRYMLDHADLPVLMRH
jgi:nucleotide-binding universal stress UspA family protein